MEPHITDQTTTKRTIQIRQGHVRVSIVLLNGSVEKIFLEAETEIGNVTIWSNIEATNSTIDDFLAILTKAKEKLGEH